VTKVLEMKKPNFYCIGTQKAATTTLHNILKNHSQIFLPNNKEAHFFDRKERYQRGFDWYLKRFFVGAQTEKAVGSFTPEYIFFPDVAKRMNLHFEDDLKFIVVLRHPIERAISHYRMSRVRGFEPLSFKEAIDREKRRIKKGDWEFNHFSYLTRGYYYQQLKRYLKFFPIENFLFLVFEEDIIKNIDETIVRIQNFLGCEVESLDTTVKSNTAKSPKFFYLNHLLYKDSFLKSVFKYLVPIRTRKKIKQGLKDINRSDKVEDPDITTEEKSRLLELYYDEEINKLEKLTRLNLRLWYQMENLVR